MIQVSVIDHKVKVRNSFYQLVLALGKGSGNFGLIEMIPKNKNYKIIKSTSNDFTFDFNGVTYDNTMGWQLIGQPQIIEGANTVEVIISLSSEDAAVKLAMHYYFYADSPIFQKQLVILNMTEEDARIENIDVIKLDTTGDFTYQSTIYHNYGRREDVGNMQGGPQDSLAIIYQPEWQIGLIIGNESTGVTKNISIWSSGRTIRVGLTHTDSSFAFRWWLQPGEYFATPMVFVGVCIEPKLPEAILNGPVNQFVMSHLDMESRHQLRQPTLIYDTWEPYHKDIDAELIKDSIVAASKAGVSDYVIDDGWQDCYGDWNVDKQKFPDGLDPIMEKIESLGMRPGLWVSIAAAERSSHVFQNYPEWFVRDNDGQIANRHDDDEKKVTACMGTGWTRYITDILVRMVKRWHLGYLKLDLATVASPYQYDPKNTGCFAEHHPGHRDREESLSINYMQIKAVIDRLHVIQPDLYVDCTFESMGAMQLIDYGMLAHADGNWLTNYPGTLGPTTDLRIRKMAWWRSPAMPASTLVIGNAEVEDEGLENHLRSLAGTMPILLGDFSQANQMKRDICAFYAKWFKRMNAQYDYMSYRQDLPDLEEPREGGFDGFARINTKTKKGGIIGIFRQGSIESTLRVRIADLDLNDQYDVVRMNGEIVFELSGRELIDKGFIFTFTQQYDGCLLEVRKISARS